MVKAQLSLEQKLLLDHGEVPIIRIHDNSLVSSPETIWLGTYKKLEILQISEGIIVAIHITSSTRR